MNSLDILRLLIEQPKVENGEVVRDKKGNPKPDSKLRDSERVPLSEDIEEYFTREVEPHLPTHGLILIKVKWVMKSISQSISTNTNLFVLSDDISNDLLELKKESENLLNLIMD